MVSLATHVYDKADSKNSFIMSILGNFVCTIICFTNRAYFVLCVISKLFCLSIVVSVFGG
jgi:hypothetical protein